MLRDEARGETDQEAIDNLRNSQRRTALAARLFCCGNTRVPTAHNDRAFPRDLRGVSSDSIPLPLGILRTTSRRKVGLPRQAFGGVWMKWFIGTSWEK